MGRKAVMVAGLWHSSCPPVGPWALQGSRGCAHPQPALQCEALVSCPTKPWGKAHSALNPNGAFCSHGDQKASGWL